MTIGCFWVRARRRSALPVVCLGLAICSAGCGATVKEAAKSATPEVVDESLEQAQKPESRADIAKIMSDPKVLEASQALARSITAGALDTLTDPEQLQQIDEFSQALAKQISSSMASSMSSELAPQISRVVADSVGHALDRMLSTETEQRVTEFTRTLSAAVVQGMTQELEGSAEGSAVSVLARQAGHGAALGFQDAVRETELRRQAGGERPGDVLALPARLADLGLGTLSLATLALGIVALGAIALLVWALVRARRLHRESQAREDALVLLASVIKSTEDTPWSAELRERLREAARGSAASDELRGVLRRHSGLRLEPRSTEPRDPAPPGPFSGTMQPAR